MNLPALLSGTAITDRVDAGTGTSLDNMVSGSVLVWHYNTNAAVECRFFQKGLSPNGHLFYWGGGVPTCGLDIHRGTANMSMRCTTANVPGFAVNAWCCFAATWDLSGANSQLLYGGNLTAPLRAVTTYSAQTAGSGTQGNNTTLSAIIGNNQNNALSYKGSLAVLVICKNLYLPPKELQRIADVTRTLHPRHWKNRLPPMAGAWSLGEGTGSQIDWSGNRNHGTITGMLAAIGPPAKAQRSRMVSVRGPVTFTGSGALTTETTTIAGTGTHTAPTYTGSGSLATEVATTAGTGAFTQPTATGSGDLATEVVTVAGTGAFTVPTYSGSGSLATEAATTDGDGAFTVPTYTGSGALACEAATMGGTGHHSMHGSGDLQTEAATMGGSGTMIPPGGLGRGAMFHRHGGPGIHSKRPKKPWS